MEWILKHRIIEMLKDTYDIEILYIIHSLLSSSD